MYIIGSIGKVRRIVTPKNIHHESFQRGRAERSTCKVYPDWAATFWVRVPPFMDTPIYWKPPYVYIYIYVYVLTYVVYPYRLCKLLATAHLRHAHQLQCEDQEQIPHHMEEAIQQLSKIHDPYDEAAEGVATKGWWTEPRRARGSHAHLATAAFEMVSKQASWDTVREQ